MLVSKLKMSILWLLSICFSGSHVYFENQVYICAHWEHVVIVIISIIDNVHVKYNHKYSILEVFFRDFVNQF